jgi:transcription antitermination factor NusG
MLTPATKSRAIVEEVPVLRLHSFERWYIVKSHPNAEAKAKGYLERENFEVFYGERQRVMTVPIPANRISSKTRHRRRSETREVVKTYPVYPGYLFARRICGDFNIYQAFDLPGIIGLCMTSRWEENVCIGEMPATVEDYTIELLRLAAARGKFSYWDNIEDERSGKIKVISRVMQLDEYSFSRDNKTVNTALRERAAEEKVKTEKAANPHEPIEIKPRTINHVDKAGNIFLYIEELGRITRIITSPDVLETGWPQTGCHAKCEA